MPTPFDPVVFDSGAFDSDVDATIILSGIGLAISFGALVPGAGIPFDVAVFDSDAFDTGATGDATVTITGLEMAISAGALQAQGGSESLFFPIAGGSLHHLHIAVRNADVQLTGLGLQIAAGQLFADDAQDLADEELIVILAALA